MANIPIPENDDSLELNVRYQPDMVLEGMLDATVPEMKYLRLSQGNETHDLLGAQSGDQIMDMLAADVEASDNGKVLTAVYGGLEGEETGSVMWASPLPFIGEGDAGKVLTVNAGETGAEWAEPSGGDRVVFTPVEDTENPGTYTFTGTTPLEVATAFNNGIPCYIHIVVSEYGEPSFDSVWQIDSCFPNNSLTLEDTENDGVVLSATQMFVAEEDGANNVSLTTYTWDYDYDGSHYRLRRTDTLLAGTPN